MTRSSLLIPLLLTSVAVLVDVQINIRGGVYTPPCTISNGQSIIADLGSINPEHVDNSRGEITKTISISCTYKSGSPWTEVAGDAMAGQINVLTTNIADFDIALYQGKEMSTLLTLGDGSRNGCRVTAGPDTAHPTFTLTLVPSRNGSRTLGGGDFRTTADVSMIYN